MLILALPDLHGDLSRIGNLSAELAQADIVLLVGDITHFGHAKEAEHIVRAIRKINPRLLAVSGNCDHLDVEDYLKQEGLSLHRQSVVVDSFAFVGVGASLPCPGKTPNEISEDSFTQYLYEAASALLLDMPSILVAHQPPFNTKNDLASIGQHVGSKSVRTFIEEHHPLLCFTGHIHEGIGVDTIGPTQIVNPGPSRHGRYALAKADAHTIAIELH